MSWNKSIRLECDSGQCTEVVGEYGDAPSAKRVLKAAYEDGWIAKGGFHFCSYHRAAAKRVRTAQSSVDTDAKENK